MKLARLFASLLFITLAARADFSYTTTSKTGGTMAAMAGAGANTPSKYYFKGQKMKSESGDIALIIDFETQKMTTINHKAKTVSVTKLGDLGAKAGDVSAKIDVKETGQQKIVNGYNAKEVLMTTEMEVPQAPQMGKMQMEMDLWLSSEVPGVGELRDFYQKNMEHLPWASMVGSNPQMQQAIAQLQRKMAEMNGVQVQTIMRVKPAGGAGAPAMPQMPQMSAAQQAQMQAAMARLQQLQQQGGPAAAAAAQAIGRMGNVGRGAAPGSSNAMIEITTDSSNFSTSPIPDSVFAIPADYSQTEQR
ncbi:MAG TPA: DUF4412 domain-containing protein [Bryobacteraceae bacterium]|jgi:hypothetical protein|nr:DUF4412 domain-containing protein [Bryobacteraceae bacterium]